MRYAIGLACLMGIGLSGVGWCDEATNASTTDVSSSESAQGLTYWYPEHSVDSIQNFCGKSQTTKDDSVTVMIEKKGKPFIITNRDICKAKILNKIEFKKLCDNWQEKKDQEVVIVSSFAGILRSTIKEQCYVRRLIEV